MPLEAHQVRGRLSVDRRRPSDRPGSDADDFLLRRSRIPSWLACSIHFSHASAVVKSSIGLSAWATTAKVIRPCESVLELALFSQDLQHQIGFSRVDAVDSQIDQFRKLFRSSTTQVRTAVLLRCAHASVSAVTRLAPSLPMYEGWLTSCFDTNVVSPDSWAARRSTTFLVGARGAQLWASGPEVPHLLGGVDAHIDVVQPVEFGQEFADLSCRLHGLILQVQRDQLSRKSVQHRFDGRYAQVLVSIRVLTVAFELPAGVEAGNLAVRFG